MRRKIKLVGIIKGKVGKGFPRLFKIAVEAGEVVDAQISEEHG